MPFQATMSRVFTKNDQFGISSPFNGSNLRGVSEAMTRTALRQVREQNRGKPVEG